MPLVRIRIDMYEWYVACVFIHLFTVAMLWLQTQDSVDTRQGFYRWATSAALKRKWALERGSLGDVEIIKGGDLSKSP